MSTNYSSDNSERQELQHYTSASVDLNGEINLSRRCTDNNLYSSNYSKRKASATKGHNGLTDKDKEKIEQALYKLGITYGFHNLKWIVLTFDTDTSDEALVNILKNYDKLRDAIRTKLNNIYKQFDINPYFVVYGIRKRTSYDRKIVCFDVNIICVAKDKEGKDLIDIDNFIYQLELSLLQKIARETVKIHYYNYAVTNTLEDYSKLANYLKKQVDIVVLKHFQQSEYADLLPNCYFYLPDSLKKTLTKIKLELLETTVSEARAILEDEFSNEVTILDKENLEHKCTAYLNHPEKRDDFTQEFQQVFNTKYPDRLENVSDNDTVI